MTNGYYVKSYEQLLKEALDDEAQAGNIYRIMADMAPNEEAVNALKAIAADKDRHYSIVSYLLNVASLSPEEKSEYVERMERALGDGHPSGVSTHRPYPQTDTDWENLGYDIEAKLPDIGEPRYSVRDAVAIATGKREGDADMAKRWLVQKAGELGIS